MGDTPLGDQPNQPDAPATAAEALAQVDAVAVELIERLRCALDEAPLEAAVAFERMLTIAKKVRADLRRARETS